MDMGECYNRMGMSAFTIEEFDEALRKSKKLQRIFSDSERFEAWLKSQPKGLRDAVEADCRKWVRDNLKEVMI